MDKGEVVLYQPDITTAVEVRLENENVWLTQQQIADLFGTKRQAITKHLKNIFDTGELDVNSVSSVLELTAKDGKSYQTKFYCLDAILSVGYRVNSINATQFRIWANRILKDYILKGYAVNKRFESLENRVTETEKKIDFFVKTALPPIQGIFFEGEIFDAYVFASDLIKSAKQSIVLIDNYIDESVLVLLSKRPSGVTAHIYTRHISPQLQLDISRHNSQYEPISINITSACHDRFLIIDNIVYFIGASLKNLGKKLFAFSKMEMDSQDILRNI
ncbi:MAG: virulence RhuM family protein [Candidatus Cloacimonetes bacterium]|nr:virulence RhuM family protein [Candidatus Cloacimonadota bacterium]